MNKTATTKHLSIALTPDRISVLYIASPDAPAFFYELYEVPVLPVVRAEYGDAEILANMVRICKRVEGLLHAHAESLAKIPSMTALECEASMREYWKACAF